jgi:hypothetical protein
MHASESTHWYAKDGSPVYEVMGANGQMRNATLRDARKLGLVPGVSAISRCAAAPGLEAWKANQVLMAALTLPRRPDEPEKDWLTRVMQDSKETGRRAAERGSAIHAAIQGHYEGKPPTEALWPFVKGAVLAVDDWLKSDWEAEKSFACHLGYGGKIDLCGLAVVDFKTKEFTSEDLKSGKQLTWDEQCIQLAAYRYGRKTPKARCANVFVSVTEPGLAVVCEWEEKELQRGFEMFTSLLTYWQVKQNFRCGWEEKVAA